MRTEKVIELSKKSKEELVEIRWGLENDLNDDLGALKRRLNKGNCVFDAYTERLVKEINEYYEYLRDLNLIIKSKGE